MTQGQVEQSGAAPISPGLLLSGEARDLFDGERFNGALSEDSELMLDGRGRAEVASFFAVRRLTRAANARVVAKKTPETPLESGRLGAVACLNRVWRRLLEVWRVEVNPQGFSQAVAWLEARLGEAALAEAVQSFGASFPPELQRRQRQCENLSIDADLEGSASLIADLVVVRLLNENPAVEVERALFDDAAVPRQPYDEIMAGIEAFFDTQPGLAGVVEADEGASADRQAGDPLMSLPLIKLLRAPIERGGDSLFSQLEFLGRHFGHLLPQGLLERILSTMDVLREEAKGRYSGPSGGPGPLETPSFMGLEALGARFSPDADWMGELVLLAKNVHVWLAQLSRREGRQIDRLDQIPDADLQVLAERGIRGLWLIGLWERSPASRRIKELSGSPHVVSSAYSIYDYRIADDLGGEDAWNGLRARAEKFGIRMAADMVPNHMGITSKWLYEHPEWFIRRDDIPYPSYRFEGENLSDNPEVGVYLEDHYYQRSDAAVVFKRVDFSTGHAEYVYHGNDGTSMPWNDTAQLDYLNPEAREAVIQQILAVARKCSIIRFDAAMTLVKKHIQRLWFPQPGSGGAIPSRAEFAMSKADFERVLPREFWTDVVERVAKEAPDTLLLAEAFWMMEGFFVRSLGMHRVYNSAFMNMLADEDNAGYRRVMKETLEFDPEILRRYVNFMSNPDEETAVAQFGKGDKYFGVCTLMATMPGLPMVGHGQVEGFAEKYGMDFNEPRLHETPDEDLIARHRRDIFPLLRHRRFFAGVENFLLYDLYTGDAGASAVDENVFAYSNRVDGMASLVIYHNRYADTRGWIRDSAAFRDKSGGGDGAVVQKRLVEGLSIEPGDEIYVTFRDQLSGLEYIRPSRELAERGFFVDLGAYDCHVFLNFQAVRDTGDQVYRKLCEHLGGRGTQSLAAELRRRELAPLHALFARAITPDLIRAFAAGQADQKMVDAHLAAIDFDQFGLLSEFKKTLKKGVKDAAGVFVEELKADFEVLLAFQQFAALSPRIELGKARDSERPLAAWAALVAWAVMRPLGGALPDEEAGLRVRSLWDEWSLELVMEQAFRALEIDARARRQENEHAVALLRFGLSRQGWLADPTTWKMPPDELLEALIADAEARQILRVNRHEDVLWYHGESFDLLLRWLVRLSAMAAALKDARAGEAVELRAPEALAGSVAEIVAASEDADYRVDRLRKALGAVDPSEPGSRT